MNLNFNLSPALIQKKLATFFSRYHLTLFILVVVGSLAFAVLLLNDTVTKSGETNGTATSASSAFDQATIDRIKQLKASGQSSQLELPAGRTNPFTE